MPWPRELTFLLAGYEMFAKAVKSNYKRLLSEANKGWRTGRKLSPRCQRKSYETNENK